MAENVSIQLEGAKELLANFSRFGAIGSKWATKAIKVSIFDIERVTKTITPIDKGRLRNSFRTNIIPMEGKLKNISDYAIFVHEGTSRWPLSSPPKNAFTVRQFMTEGLERTKTRIHRNFQKAGDHMTKELAGKTLI